MRKAKKTIGRILIAAAAMGLFGCSFQDNQLSPEQVINNAMKETDERLSYYGEATMEIDGENMEKEIIKMKEWRSADGRVRVETAGENEDDQALSVNDGTTFTIYQESLNQAFISEDDELLSVMMPTPKEQANQLLKMVGDSHAISIEGEEKVAGRDTYHLVAKTNEKNTLLGDQELWVDKENWFVLKMIASSGDNHSEVIYTKIDFNYEMTDDLFIVELPDDVDIQNFDELNETTEVTIDEAVDQVGQPLLYFPETKDQEISKIETDELTGELARVEVNIAYEQDGLPLLSLSMFKTPEDLADSEDLSLPGEEEIEIRGTEGTMMDMENFRTLFWKEDGLSYSIIINDPNLTFEQVIDWTNNMELAE